MYMDIDQLAERAGQVLEENWNQDHTMPAPHLYPHQWLWDTCFIAIGRRHIDVVRAKTELLRLFEGQWANGMIPHMIFDPAKKYKRDREIWRSYVSPYSPDNHATSGITQPPIIAEAVVRVGQKLKKTERLAFYRQVLPGLLRYHTWLMTERDPHGEGLVLQIHPWETGLDNTPPWMIQLHEHSKPWWITLIETLKLDQVVNLIRRDTRHVPPGQRITNIEALMVWDIIRRFRRKGYDIQRILHRSLFCIEDVSFNSILARNNTLLKEIAKETRRKLEPELETMIARQAEALESCWHDEKGTYFSRDFITHEHITESTIGSLIPLYSGTITKERAERLVEILRDYHHFGLKHPVPSVPLSSTYFDAERYWQGPAWINTNWMLIDGLKRYGFHDEATSLATKTLELVHEHGPFEYFSPIDGQPLGSPDFSWTAALTIDLLTEHTSKV